MNGLSADESAQLPHRRSIVSARPIVDREQKSTRGEEPIGPSREDLEVVGSLNNGRFHRRQTASRTLMDSFLATLAPDLLENRPETTA